MKARMIVTGLCLLMLCSILLVACGFGKSGGDNTSGSDPADGRLVGGIEGVTFSSQSSYTDPTTGATTSKVSNGSTGEAGQFKFAYIEPEPCTTDSSGKQTCDYIGINVYGPATFSICDGVSFTAPGPTTYGFQTASFTQLDLFPDPTAAENLASVELMANANSGDPAKTGIKLSSALLGATCQSFDWATKNLQQDAASIQTAAKKDGLPHAWPDAQTASDFVTKTYLCSHSGVYGGTQYNIETPGYPAQSMSGNFWAFVDATGQVDGFFDFTGALGGAPLVGPIPFSGNVSIARGSIGTVTYTAPADALLPGLNVGMSLYPNGATGTWQTADGSIAGSTAYTSPGWGPGVGLYNESVAFPRYRFLAKNLTYTPPGGNAPRKYVLTLEVGYDNQVNGGLAPWPPDPKLTVSAFLAWGGSLSGNTLSLYWISDPNRPSDPSSQLEFRLTLDPDTNTLTGVFPGYNDEPFESFTTSQPLQGCRM
jgi:hypothetical protein